MKVKLISRFEFVFAVVGKTLTVCSMENILVQRKLKIVTATCDER